MTEVSVVIIYTESALTLRAKLTFQPNAKVDDVREKVQELTSAYIQSQCPETRVDVIHSTPASVILATDKRPFSSFEKEFTPIEPLLDLHGSKRDLYAIVPSPAKPDTIVDDSNGAFLAVNYPEYLESPVIEPMKSKIQELTATLEEAKTKRAADVKHERSQKAKAKDELRSEKSARQSDNHLIQELRIRMDGMDRRNKASDRRNEASDRRNEASDRRNEASDRRIEELDRELKDAKEKITALQSAVLYEDFRPLRLIQLRAALDVIQADFEDYLLPNPKRKTASQRWRDRLSTDVGQQDQSRIDHARTLMAKSPSTYKDVLKSDAAMLLICQHTSSIRKTGDRSAHSYADTRDQLAKIQGELGTLLSDPVERKGMSDILDCLSQRFGS